MHNFFERLLIDYLPDVVSNVREYRTIMAAEQPEMFDFIGKVIAALNNQFVLTADEYGIRRWEKILNIFPDTSIEDLNFRRQRIIARLLTKIPFTERFMQRYFDSLFGAEFWQYTMEYDIYNIQMMILFPEENWKREIDLFFKTMLPANMTHHIIQDYPMDIQPTMTAAAIHTILVKEIYTHAQERV